jgi:uncharacterized protein YhfF
VSGVGDVDLAFARDEGEGFDSVEQWRSAHEAFWEGHEISDHTLIVAVRFRVVQAGLLPPQSATLRSHAEPRRR